jgi:hypothetical protein
MISQLNIKKNIDRHFHNMGSFTYYVTWLFRVFRHPPEKVVSINDDGKKVRTVFCLGAAGFLEKKKSDMLRFKTHSKKFSNGKAQKNFLTPRFLYISRKVHPSTLQIGPY